ncbi:hypothetical protein [Agathobaculum sp.]|uniref:hypothetical protein n=1 Tax=Agathobaculum sp. TaxID=2048138 RepID=UPI003AF02095
MKKRYIAGLALALVGILSGCGQTKTQPADNTMHLAPVEFSAEQAELLQLAGVNTTADRFFLYEFSGNHTEANGTEICHYIWKDSQWTPYKRRDGLVSGRYAQDLNGETGKIAFHRDGDSNSDFSIEVHYPDGGWSHLKGGPGAVSDPTEGRFATISTMEEPIDDLAVGVEIPILIRVFHKEDTIWPLSIDAFSDPESSESLQKSSYAEVYTVKFVKKDNP